MSRERQMQRCSLADDSNPVIPEDLDRNLKVLQDKCSSAELTNGLPSSDLLARGGMIACNQCRKGVPLSKEMRNPWMKPEQYAEGPLDDSTAL